MTMEDLPRELQDRVLDFLDTTGVKSIRLVRSSWRTCGAERLFRNVFCSGKGLNTLDLISKDPMIQASLRHLTINTNEYEWRNGKLGVFQYVISWPSPNNVVPASDYDQLWWPTLDLGDSTLLKQHAVLCPDDGPLPQYPPATDPKVAYARCSQGFVRCTCRFGDRQKHNNAIDIYAWIQNLHRLQSLDLDFTASCRRGSKFYHLSTWLPERRLLNAGLQRPPLHDLKLKGLAVSVRLLSNILNGQSGSLKTLVLRNLMLIPQCEDSESLKETKLSWVDIFLLLGTSLNLRECSLEGSLHDRGNLGLSHRVVNANRGTIAEEQNSQASAKNLRDKCISFITHNGPNPFPDRNTFADHRQYINAIKACQDETWQIGI